MLGPCDHKKKLEVLEILRYFILSISPLFSLFEYFGYITKPGKNIFRIIFLWKVFFSLDNNRTNPYVFFFLAFHYFTIAKQYCGLVQVYGGEARISTLRSLFPRMEDKKSLTSKEERAQIKGKASLLAAVDYYVSMYSDIFISASPGNMHNAMVSYSCSSQMLCI